MSFWKKSVHAERMQQKKICITVTDEKKNTFIFGLIEVPVQKWRHGIAEFDICVVYLGYFTPCGREEVL